MHVHAQPVAGAVHIELKIGALLDHILQATELVAVQQTEVQHALRQHLDGGLMRIGEAGAGAGRGNGSLL